MACLLQNSLKKSISSIAMKTDITLIKFEVTIAIDLTNMETRFELA